MKSQLNLNYLRAALILFSAAFILLITNIFVQNGNEYNSTGTRIILNNDEIDSLFHVSLKNFGLPDESILRKNISESAHSYTIKIPTDLSIPVVLNELNHVFAGVLVTISAVEKSFNGLTANL